MTALTSTLSPRVNRQAWLKFFTHATVILLIFVLPEFMFRASNPRSRGDMSWDMMMYLKTALYIGIFYLNYYLIIPRTLFCQKQKVWTFIGLNLMIVVASISLFYWVQYISVGLMHGKHAGHYERLMRTASFFVRDVVMMILTIGLSVALKLGERWMSIEQRHERLEAMQRSSELENLKSQLNPHFLFNTLNTIYALIEISPKQAQSAVHELSTMLRYVMYENPAEVQLSDEIKLAKSYISLMEMRLGPDVIKATFDEGHNPKVAPLLFVTLMENAFKHGNTGNRQHPIEISIVADENDNIECKTVNHYVVKDLEEKSSKGIGLANLRRRLQLIYGDNACLEIQKTDGVYNASLKISSSNQIL